MTLPRVNVLDVNVSAINMAQALATIGDWVRRREQHYVCITGVHGVMESQRDEHLRRIHNQAGMVTPDGMPLVWLSRLQGFRYVTRVYGPDLMLATCERSVEKGYRHFFYGGGEGVPELLAERLTRRFPGLRVAGAYSPPFRRLSSREDAQIVARINDAAPDIVWVGLSTPKQELWMHQHLGRVSAPVMVGVGAAFDFLAGLKPQAPMWMQRNGLEWVFRLLTEPRRLWRRYLMNNPRFVYGVVRHAFGLRQEQVSAIDLVRSRMDGNSIAEPNGFEWRAEDKARVVLQVLGNRMSMRRACRRYGVSDAELQEWTARFLGGAATALDQPSLAGDTNDTDGESKS